MHTKEWLHLRVTSHTSHIQNTQKGLSEFEIASSSVYCDTSFKLIRTIEC
jgi:hypothetical protein